jgi:CheY-like chemotaxis protein
VETQPFPEALEGLVDLQQAMAGDCQLELDIQHGTPAGPLGARGAEVLRIVGQALTNARRHSGARHVRVTAGLSSDDKLCVEVTDDGKGFDEVSDQPATRGTGLRSMRERAALLDGELDIRSAPGAGTRLRLELPLGEEGAAPAETVRILLVEDHASVREAIAAMFGREPGLAVVAEAASLAEARTKLGGVDVAVLDLGLPDGFGADLIKELREANPHAEALVLSASLDAADTARALQSGAAGAFDKSARLDEVVEAVRRLGAGVPVGAHQQVA